MRLVQIEDRYFNPLGVSYINEYEDEKTGDMITRIHLLGTNAGRFDLSDYNLVCEPWVDVKLPIKEVVEIFDDAYKAYKGLA